MKRFFVVFASMMLCLCSLAFCQQRIVSRNIQLSNAGEKFGPATVVYHLKNPVDPEDVVVKDSSVKNAGYLYVTGVHCDLAGTTCSVTVRSMNEVAKDDAQNVILSIKSRQLVQASVPAMSVATPTQLKDIAGRQILKWTNSEIVIAIHDCSFALVDCTYGKIMGKPETSNSQGSVWNSSKPPYGILSVKLGENVDSIAIRKDPRVSWPTLIEILQKDLQ